MVGWFSSRVVYATSSWRASGIIRSYNPHKARPQYINRYVVRPITPQIPQRKSFPALMREGMTAVTHYLSAVEKLMEKSVRNLLDKRRDAGQRPPWFLPEWRKKTDVPL